MPSYTAEEKARALGALRASAEVVDGEMAPRFHAVSKMEGMPSYTTLRKWWSERDREGDLQFLEELQRERESDVAKGADAWRREQLDKCRDVVEYILDPMHRTGGPGERVAPHHMAIALKHLLPTLSELDRALNGSQSRSNAQRINQLKIVARRVRITEKRKARAQKGSK